MSIIAIFDEVFELAALLAAAGPKVEDEAGDSVGDVAEQLQADARAAAPVETGELRASIYLRRDGTSSEVGSDVRQGFFQEFGTSVMPPQPWLWPAAATAERSLLDALSDVGDPFD